MPRPMRRKAAPLRKPRPSSKVQVRPKGPGPKGARVWIPATQSSDAHYGTGKELGAQNRMLAKKRNWERKNPNRNAT